MKMIHKTQLEIKMIQGEMAEALHDLNSELSWVMELMILKEFQEKYDLSEFSKKLIDRIRAIEDDVIAAGRSMSDSPRKQIINAFCVAMKDKQ